MRGVMSEVRRSAMWKLQILRESGVGTLAWVEARTHHCAERRDSRIPATSSTAVSDVVVHHHDVELARLGLLGLRRGEAALDLGRVVARRAPRGAGAAPRVTAA